MFDLRSDFLSPPTREMIDAMTAAAAAPQGFGLRENAHQRALEAEAATLLGKDDALLFPTCTMANLAAAMAQARPGETVLAAEDCHCVLSEGGGMGAVAGLMIRGLPAAHGCIDLARLGGELAVVADPQRPRVGLVVLETTHNRAGGVPLPLAHIDAVGALAALHEAPLHIDGARLFNAVAALGVSADRMVSGASTVSISLNKGLGAPAGAVLAGPRAVVERAVELRQRLGGGMRPVDAIAAAGLVALRTMPGRLADDHANATALRDALSGHGLAAGPSGATTNMVLLETGLSEAGVVRFLEMLAARGVRGIGFGPGRVRFCLHRGIGPVDIPTIAAAIAAAYRETQDA